MPRPIFVVDTFCIDLKHHHQSWS